MVEFLKAGPDRWMSRNGNWTIERVSTRQYVLRNGFGLTIGEPHTSLPKAKTAATTEESK